MSTDTPTRIDLIKVGVMCYLHLWAALRKYVSLKNHEIAADIGIWNDDDGGYFAAFNQGNARLLQVNTSYVCALGEDGPMVGQLQKIPPCMPVILPRDVVMLINALAEGEGGNTDTILKQIEMLAMLIDKKMPAGKRQASAN